MNIFSKEFWGFGKKAPKEEKQYVSVIESLPLPGEQARVIPLINKDQEYDDLHDKHEAFFNMEESPIEQLQPRLGGKTSNHLLANIADVVDSRSNRFFQNAPTVSDAYKPDFKTDEDVSRDFEKLEEYMGIEIHEDENTILS
jgi:hypothetical protein